MIQAPLNKRDMARLCWTKGDEDLPEDLSQCNTINPKDCDDGVCVVRTKDMNPEHKNNVSILMKYREELPTCTSVFSSYTTLDPIYAGKDWDGEPKYTTYTEWKGTLDYIFQVENEYESVHARGEHPHHRLVPCNVLQLPDPSLFVPGLPNHHFGSDHVSLVVEFVVTP